MLNQKFKKMTVMPSLSALALSWKAPVTCVLSVRPPSAHIYVLCYHWMDFSEISYCVFIWKSVGNYYFFFF